MLWSIKKFIVFLILLFFPLIQNKSHYQENKKLNEKKKPKTKQNTMYKNLHEKNCVNFCKFYQHSNNTWLYTKQTSSLRQESGWHYLNKFSSLQSSWNVKAYVHFHIGFLICQFDYWNLSKDKTVLNLHVYNFHHVHFLVQFYSHIKFLILLLNQLTVK